MRTIIQPIMKLRSAILVLIIVCALFESKAQTAKGSFMIGGSMNLQRERRHYTDPNFTGNSYPEARFSVSPTVGFFPTNNLMIGVQPSYGRSWTLNTEYNNTTFGAGPIVRYYFPIGKFAIFPEATASFNRSSFKATTFDQAAGQVVTGTVHQNYNIYRGGLGVAWFLSSNIAVEGILSYRTSKYFGEDTQDRKLSTLVLNFGIQFYFPKKD